MCGCGQKRFGSISITSSPMGASVYLDGTATGQKTNLVLDSLEVGEHTLKLSLTGYEDYYDTVAVVADDTVEVSAALKALPFYGAIQVNSTPTGAAIYLDGVTTNHSTNYLLTDIPVGSHTIKLAKTGYVDRQDTVVVVKNDTVEVSAVLTQAAGAVRVNSEPTGAAVWLDTVNTGWTTNCVVTGVPVGSHAVKLIKPEYQDYDTAVLVVQDETTEVSAALVRAYQIFGSCNTPGFTYAAVVAGNYAYVADGDSGLAVVDLSDRSQPHIVGSIKTSGKALGITLKGSFVLLAAAGGLVVVDVTNPASPATVATCALAGTPTGVFASGDYAYVAAGSAGLLIVNVANPSAPTLASSYQTSGPAKAVFVFGNNAYVATGSAGLEIVDISLPWNPRLVGKTDTPGDACGISVTGSYTYIADGSAGLEIISGTKTGNFDTPDYAQGVFGMNNYAYVVDRSAGLFIVDAVLPLEPKLIGRCDTPGQAQSVWVSGSYIYISDGDAGLEIIKL